MLFIPLYHSLDAGTAYPYALPRAVFARHLFLLEQMHTCVDATTAEVCMDAPECTFDRTMVQVQFDDGYEDNMQLIDILENYRVPVTLFIATEYIGKKLDGRSMLDVSQLRELNSHPLVSFGSHAHSHRKLIDISAEELMYEFEKSKAVLEDVLGDEIVRVSYPKSASNVQVRECAARVYAYGYGSSKNDVAVGGYVDNMQIPRVAQEGKTPLWKFVAQNIEALWRIKKI